MSRIYSSTGFYKMLLLCLVTATCHTNLSAQSLTTEGEQRVVTLQYLDVRSLSMGSATLSDRLNLSPMGINASLMALREPGSSVQFNSAHYWTDNRMMSSLTLPTLSAGPHRVTGRFGLSHQGSDQFNYLKTTSQATPDLQVYQADVAYAYRFSSVFSMGLLNRFALMQNNDRELLAFAVDLGLVYAPQGKITYAMIARGIGRQGTYGYNAADVLFIGSTGQETSIELGATIHYPIESNPILSVSFANEKKLYEDGIWYKGGVEVLPIPMIALRSGILFHLEQSVAIPRFGMGIHAGKIHLDYMVSPYKRVGEQFHQLGVTIEF